MAISTRDWQSLRKRIENTTDSTKGWELAFASLFSIFLSFALPLTTTNQLNGSGSMNGLFVFYLVATVFSLCGSIFSLIAMRSHKQVTIHSKKSVLDYMDEVSALYSAESSRVDPTDETDENEFLYNEAVKIAKAAGKVSTSFLQRKMRISYSRAARIVEQMEKDGIASSPEGSLPRRILK